MLTTALQQHLQARGLKVATDLEKLVVNTTFKQVGLVVQKPRRTNKGRKEKKIFTLDSLGLKKCVEIVYTDVIHSSGQNGIKSTINLYSPAYTTPEGEVLEQSIVYSLTNEEAKLYAPQSWGDVLEGRRETAMRELKGLAVLIRSLMGIPTDVIFDKYLTDILHWEAFGDEKFAETIRNETDPEVIAVLESPVPWDINNPTDVIFPITLNEELKQGDVFKIKHAILRVVSNIYPEL